MKRIRVEEIDGIIYIDGVDIIKKLSELSKENDRLFLENDNLKKTEEQHRRLNGKLREELKHLKNN
ncbi:MAG: hypothetical protein PUJ51_16505 [Clostridiales bacterium]|uniref:hypothetical protein n=1 Tax=Terrisporobacter sp. TaxID=1965305 RepID=UPI002A4EE17B|nr:hypothetical protein [Terrisporobacter sp.]MDD7756090.1 hypothetical protein [Clostridiales bacterium]MDY4135291.1 hypothetical protein [Terrisporobacter sp.]